VRALVRSLPQHSAMRAHAPQLLRGGGLAPQQLQAPVVQHLQHSSSVVRPQARAARGTPLHATASRLTMPGGLPGAIRDVRDLPGESGGSSGVQCPPWGPPAWAPHRPHIHTPPARARPSVLPLAPAGPRACCTRCCSQHACRTPHIPRERPLGSPTMQALRWTPPRTPAWRT